MKRFLTISTLFALSLAFTGCQFFQQQPEPTETDTEVSESTTATVNIVDEAGDSATSTGTLVIEDDAMMEEGDAMMDTMLEGSEMPEDDNMVGGDAMVGDDDAMMEDDTMMEDEA